jgi:hypothetical protein
MSWKRDDRRTVLPPTNALNPQPAYLCSLAAQGVRCQGSIALRALLGEEFSQGEREGLLAAAAADPRGFSDREVIRNFHSAVESAGWTTETHGPNNDGFPCLCQTPQNAAYAEC